MGVGFFTAKDFKITNPAVLASGCGRCRLFKNCITPKMKPFGECKRGLMILGEAPGANEDAKGIPFIGKSGRLLNDMLQDCGIDVKRDAVKLNAVSCRPPKNRTPSAMEIESCRSRVWKAIKEYKPRVILALGMVSLQSLLAHRWFDEDGLGAMQRWRGFAAPDKELECWVCPTFHPAYILRMEKEPVYEKVFFKDIKNAVRHLDMPVPKYENVEENVHVLTKEEDVCARLTRIRKNKPVVVFDYETTGLKPFNEAQSIVYIGIADSLSSAMCFPAETMPNAVRLWGEICADPEIPKIAHHISFEDLWTREKIGVQVQNWMMCTMETAHVLDQRKGVCGLKFQAYVKTGVTDYSSGISPYLKPTTGSKKWLGDNAVNTIRQAPPAEVMKYCGLDCLNTYALAVEQCKELKEDMEWVRK